MLQITVIYSVFAYLVLG